MGVPGIFVNFTPNYLKGVETRKRLVPSGWTYVQATAHTAERREI